MKKAIQSDGFFIVFGDAGPYDVPGGYGIRPYRGIRQEIATGLTALAMTDCCDSVGDGFPVPLWPS